MEPNAGRLEVRERVVRLLLAVVITSSVSSISLEEGKVKKRMGLTNKMFEDHRLIMVPRFRSLAHLHSFAHFPIPIPECH